MGIDVTGDAAALVILDAFLAFDSEVGRDATRSNPSQRASPRDACCSARPTSEKLVIYARHGSGGATQTIGACRQAFAGVQRCRACELQPSTDS